MNFELPYKARRNDMRDGLNVWGPVSDNDNGNFDRFGNPLMPKYPPQFPTENRAEKLPGAAPENTSSSSVPQSSLEDSIGISREVKMGRWKWSGDKGFKWDDGEFERLIPDMKPNYIPKVKPKDGLDSPKVDGNSVQKKELIFGGGNDKFTVSNEDNFSKNYIIKIDAGGGNDTIIIPENAKRDYFVKGDWGNDYLMSRSVNGELGNRASGGYGQDTILGFSEAVGGGDSDYISAHYHTTDRVIYDGGSGNDTLLGSGGHDILAGDYGNDYIVGAGGNDLISGQNGNDSLEGGYSGNDTISGGNGNDTIKGGNGNDIIQGGKGRDELYGGTGKDTFVFERRDADDGWWSMDVIKDFEPSTHAAGDTIDLTDYGLSYHERDIKMWEYEGDTYIQINRQHTDHNIIMLEGVTGVDFCSILL